MAAVSHLLTTSRFLIEGFEAFRESFNQISRGARTRFETRDWKGMQADGKARLTLYKRRVAELALGVRGILQEQYADPVFWQMLKQAYSYEVVSFPDTEIAETFFNSVCRKVIGGFGADAQMMFVEGEIMRLDFESAAPIFHTWSLMEPLETVMSELLQTYAFTTPYENAERDMQNLCRRLRQEVLADYAIEPGDSLEMLKEVFFRNKAAYLVGRLRLSGQIFPFCIPLLNREPGVFVDALILDADTMSIIFSFTRSYFLVEVAIPTEVVRFLKSVMPLKSGSELYNSLGFHKHGKTKLYRDILRHLHQHEEQFIVAPGIRGMVMAVFTLPSYPIVFKLIKDKFDPPKVTNRPMVRMKYRLVKHHDRVGRMADTHEFEYFAFPRSRFSDSLLEELLRVAPSMVEIKGDQVIIQHLYTERRMIPLNMFIETAQPAELAEVIGEYGNTIKQLAAVNIFPGDMLLKNFGVTRHCRVVFYDYDEIGFLTEYTFREMPKRAVDDPYGNEGTWLEVNEKDVFPEEFRHFLIGHKAMEEQFVAQHADLFSLEFWHKMQALQRNGEILDVFPYRRRLRFVNE